MPFVSLIYTSFLTVTNLKICNFCEPCHVNKCLFSMLRWPTVNRIEKFIYLSLNCAFNRGSLRVNRTPLLYERKVDHHPVTFGGLNFMLNLYRWGPENSFRRKKRAILPVQRFFSSREGLLLWRPLSSSHLPFPPCCSSVARFPSLCCLICWQLSGIYYASISEAI